MYQSRYANQITGTNTVPQRSPVSAMTGTEAAMVGGRFSFAHWIASSNYKSVRGHTFACTRPGAAPHPATCAQRESLSDPAPVRIAYGALGFLIVAAVALILIEARYL